MKWVRDLVNLLFNCFAKQLPKIWSILTNFSPLHTDNFVVENLSPTTSLLKNFNTTKFSIKIQKYIETWKCWTSLLAKLHFHTGEAYKAFTGNLIFDFVPIVLELFTSFHKITCIFLFVLSKGRLSPIESILFISLKCEKNYMHFTLKLAN